MSENDNIRKLQELYEAFGRGDINMILSNVTDDVDWGTESSAAPSVPWHSIRHGREGVADFFATLDREVEFTTFSPGHFAGAGDRVYAHIDLTYRFKKNGHTVPLGAVHEFTFRDGNLVRFRAYEDTAAIRDAWDS